MPPPLHVREFIQSALYQQKSGYFEHLPVYDFKSLVNFPSFANLSTWRQYKQQLVNKTTKWTTPVELFQPHYSTCIAKYILEQKTNNENHLNIVEIGGGNGTNALHILKYFSNMTSKNIQYTLCEISPQMAQKQHQTLSNQQFPSHVQFNIIQQDFLQWKQIQPINTFVIGLEVLDNLPHDKFRFLGAPPQPFSSSTAHLWKEILVEQDSLHRWIEIVDQPITNPLSIESAHVFLQTGRFIHPKQNKIFHRFPRSLDEAGIMLAKASMRQSRLVAERPVNNSSSYRDFFIPTGMLQFIHVIKQYFPQPKLILADFDELPACEGTFQKHSLPGALIGCINHPIVSGTTHDYPTYLMDPGTADIFFQVHFDILSEILQEYGIQNNSITIQRSNEFLQQFTQQVKETTLRDGSNPMLFEFQNTCFLFTR